MPSLLAQYLVAQGALTSESADEAFRRQAALGGTLDTALLEQRQLTEARLLSALGEVSGHRIIDLAEFQPNLEVSGLIPPKIAERLKLVPLSLEQETLHVACTYPIPTRELSEISFLLGRQLEPWVTLEVRLREWLAALYGLSLTHRYQLLLSSLQSPPVPSPPVPLLEETTLEEKLTREMGDHPIPLTVKKSEIAFPWMEPSVSTSSPLAPPTPPSRQSEDLPRWTLQQARFALGQAAGNADRILGVTLRFGLNVFEFVAAFAVMRGVAVGWEMRSSSQDAPTISGVSIPLDAFSVFRTATLTRGSFIGPPPPDAFTGYYLEKLHRKARVIVLYPVEIRSKVGLIIYGDAGLQPISQSRLSDFLLFCQGLPSALIEAALPQLFPATDDGGAVDSGSAADQSGDENLEIALSELTGPDVERRFLAAAHLRRFPEAAARELAARFPGPSAWARGPVSQLPSPDELGPIPWALAGLGPQASAALLPLLDCPDVDARYMALLTAGSLPYPELLEGVHRGLFDPHPDIASAAVAAAVGMKSLPLFEAMLRSLRQELTGADPSRRACAARVLGALHDRDAIDALVQLAESEDPDCAQVAMDSLKEITKATHHTAARWSQWWLQNRDRPRSEWLVDGLRHPDLDVRLSAIDELATAFGERLGYFADGHEVEREAASMRWAAKVKEAGTEQVQS